MNCSDKNTNNPSRASDVGSQEKKLLCKLPSPGAYKQNKSFQEVIITAYMMLEGRKEKLLLNVTCSLLCKRNICVHSGLNSFS